MRTFALGILYFSCSFTLVAQTQTMQPQHPAAQDGGTREVLESVVIPPIQNQPLSGHIADRIDSLHRRRWNDYSRQ